MHRRAGTETRPYNAYVSLIKPRDSSQAQPVQNDRTTGLCKQGSHSQKEANMPAISNAGRLGLFKQYNPHIFTAQKKLPYRELFVRLQFDFAVEACAAKVINKLFFSCFLYLWCRFFLAVTATVISAALTVWSAAFVAVVFARCC